MKKYLVIPIIIGLLVTGYALSQSESYESPEINPVEDDKIESCFTVTIEVVATSNTRQYDFCRKYPDDLLNKCQYTRYGKAFNCKNVLKKTVEQDLKKWYRIKVPTEIKAKIKLKDLTLTSISHPDYQNWVGCKYDFMTDSIKC